jgi:digeranylgeranylglycerophospholipid reductase
LAGSNAPAGPAVDKAFRLVITPMNDVIVIGAGITGSYTASELGKLGYQVCVLDKNPGAGNKNSCTGIVSGECLELLPVPAGIIQHKAHSAKIFSPSGKLISVDRESTQAYILDRPALDRHMAGQAQANHVEYRFNTLVEAIYPHDSYVGINCRHNQQQFELKARAAVIAGGFSSSLTDQLGLGRISYYAHGAQAEVACRDIDETEVYCGSAIAPGFFAWLVPAGGSKAKAGLLCRTNPREFMSSLLDRLASEGKIVKGDYRINYGNIPLKPLNRTYGNRFVVIGDAAGQVKPTTGGGIYFGLLSAREAVGVLNEAFKAGDLSAGRLSLYQKRWHKILGRELTIDYWAHRFYQKLDDRQIAHIFDIIERHGIHESFLTSPDISFDWHSKIITEAIKHRSLQRSLEKFNLKTPARLKQEKRS